MIIEKRKTHFLSFIVLGCILPVIFFIGALFPPEYPLVRELDTQIFPSHKILTPQEKSSRKLISSNKLSSGKIQLLAQTFLQNNSVILELKPLSNIQVPAPLIYWQKGNDTPTEITENTILLGSLSGKSTNFFKLPSEILGENGQLIIYAQGYQEITVFFPIKFSSS
jgi:hypothetical protein